MTVQAKLSHRRVLNIALPIVVSNATIPLLGAVDTGVVGQMGHAASLGAVGMGAVILTTFYWMFGFLRMGTSGLAAQARGLGEAQETSAILIRALMIGLLAGLVFVVLQVPMITLALRVAPASAEVEALARSYLEIRVWGAPATIALYAVTGWLIAVERTRGILLLQLWMNGVNILLDVWLVLSLGWGVQGAASATLVAEWSGLAFGLWLCRDALAHTFWKDWAQLMDVNRVARMARVNGDIMLRSVMLQGAFTSFVFLGARLGDVTLAANQVLLQFLEITAYALDGFAFAAESLVGQAVGARSLLDLRRAALMTSQWGVGTAILLGLSFLLFGAWFIDILSTSTLVRTAAREYLGWVALAPIVGIACWMLDGIFIGATRGRDMRNAMGITMLAYVPALLALPIWFGNHGLWAALLVLLIARGISLGWLYPKLEASLAD